MYNVSFGRRFPNRVRNSLSWSFVVYFDFKLRVYNYQYTLYQQYSLMLLYRVLLLYYQQQYTHHMVGSSSSQQQQDCPKQVHCKLRVYLSMASHSLCAFKSSLTDENRQGGSRCTSATTTGRSLRLLYTIIILLIFDYTFSITIY